MARSQILRELRLQLVGERDRLILIKAAQVNKLDQQISDLNVKIDDIVNAELEP